MWVSGNSRKHFRVVIIIFHAKKLLELFIFLLPRKSMGKKEIERWWRLIRIWKP
jgi:hypothetical protein